MVVSRERPWGTRQAHGSQKERDVPIRAQKEVTGPQGRGEGLEHPTPQGKGASLGVGSRASGRPGDQTGLAPHPLGPQARGRWQQEAPVLLPSYSVCVC